MRILLWMYKGYIICKNYPCIIKTKNGHVDTEKLKSLKSWTRGEI